MANLQVAGFQPVYVIGGGPITYKRGRVLSNNTTAIFKYDALKVAATGDYLVATATNTAPATVAVGAVYTDATGIRKQAEYLPAATTYSGTAFQSPNASYVIAVDNEVQTVFRASIDEAIVIAGLGVNYVMVLGTGSTTTGLSGHELDATSPNTTATFPWRVADVVRGSTESDPDIADAHVFCQINRSLTAPALSDGTGT